MGLLTDPSAGQGKFIQVLLRYNLQIFLLLYIVGLAWFYSLASSSMNNETYFSENALLPGLVQTEYQDGRTPQVYYEELLDEMKKYKDTIPYPWLLAKMRQIGLEAYTHSFTLHYPLKNLNFTGKNVYGILRAPRASSTEALVMSAPYRPPLSVHQDTTASIAYMLSFAKFAYRGKYWAKDIIFLITEHEQLGMQAWLEAYHGISCGSKAVLDHGDIKGRAGAIQAAINLEFHDIPINKIELKIEGLNGQLPNLDLFNLAARMCIKENIRHTFKNRWYRSRADDMYKNFNTLMNMVMTQATGIPTGNHGLFYRFGIQALTLEGFAPSDRKGDPVSVGRFLEGIFRSLNNLLERFHQSFFYYLLPASDRFISIGLYIPSICLLVATLYIKAYAKWCELHQSPLAENATSEQRAKFADYIDDDLGSGIKPKELSMKEWKAKFNNEAFLFYKFHKKEVRIGYLAIIIIFCHVFGAIAKYIPRFLVYYGSQLNYSTEVSVYYGLGIYSFVLLFLPAVFRCVNFRTMAIVNIFSLLELGTVLICISMYNISLALCCATVLVPFAISMYPSTYKCWSIVQKCIFILVHPFVVLHIVIFAYTYKSFSDESLTQIFSRAIGASQHAIVFSIVDSEIYGNWLYNVISCIFLSNWCCLWASSFVTYLNPESVNVNTKDKDKKD